VTRKITGALILGCIAVLVVWDIVMATNATEGDTISELALSLSLGNPIIPFAVGVICGHWFWPVSKTTESKRSKRDTIDSEGPTRPG
jgi:hypothetical protein